MKRIFLQKIKKTEDGNFIFRCNFYHLYHDEKSYHIIRHLIYNYIKSNQSEILEFVVLKIIIILLKYNLITKLINMV